MTNPPAIGESLHRLLHAYRRAMREGHAAAGIELPVTHIRALKGVAHSRSCSAQTIAGALRLDKGQISRLIKDLRTDGLIEQRPDPDDSRSRRLSLTAEGTAMVERITVVEAKAGERMAAGLDDAQLRDFVRLADVMAANLEDQE
ncbi:MarR family winged helix-turn-helix transcriptional regulator [Salinisphaera dokdonensis]